MAATNNQLTAPYFSSSPPKWDAFLSFYGKDTRYNFTSHLYSALDGAGIETFIDDKELGKGEGISPGLLKAINGSKMFVVVLSENYARSPWCLNELVEILRCKRTKNQVIPVFYYVDPSHLRYNKRSFGEAFENHKSRYSVDMIDKWKSALAEIAQLSGYHLKKDSDKKESDIVQDIVENVARRTSAQVLYLEENLFGIDSAVDEIYQRLSMNSNDVRAIGICGMAGIGKTTTAKAFYNNYSYKFDSSCFIPNVKQYSQRGSPLLPLLEQLLIELLRRKDHKVADIESGIRQLKKILCSNRALIVLDDLDQSGYSEFLVRLCNLFSDGTRIIITTRDENLLNQLKVDIPEVEIYRVKVLEQKESLKLFSYYAFKKATPPENLRDLSMEFVNCVGGLPLAIKLLGSSLRGRTHVSFWKAQLEKARLYPDIRKILKLSYNELGDETVKKIFLDIVFFFIGKDKDDAVHVFKSCDYYPEVGIPILVERCLLTIDEDNKFQMHNLIEDMGKEVICEESEHGKCTRLYRCQEENACEALQNREGTNKIEGLILDLTKWTKKNINAKVFETLPNLKLLEIIGAHGIDGNLENSFHQLRCIRWTHCPWLLLPSTFCPKELVSLDMPFTEFKTLWKDTMPPDSLKTINVGYSINLTTIPAFKGLKLVEALFVRGCKCMPEVNPSTGHVTDLYLDEYNGLKELTKPNGPLNKLKWSPEPLNQLTNGGYNFLLINQGGYKIQGLQQMTAKIFDKLCNLRVLEIIDADDLKGNFTEFHDLRCLRWMRLPSGRLEILQKITMPIKHLVRLDLGHCRNLKLLRGLKQPIIQPTNLGRLNLRHCLNLKRLPEQLGNMKGLKMLDASHTTIEQLPDSIAYLKELVELKLSRCRKLRKLPEQLGNMKGLKIINASYTTIEQLPGSIVHLKKLVELELYNCKNLKKLPEQIGEMESLRTFNASCSAIEHLPDSFVGLISLAFLHLSSCKNLTSLPDSICKLKFLQILNLGICSKLNRLPEHLGNMQCLEELNVSFTAIEKLPDSIGLLSSLQVLDLRCCTKLKYLPISIGSITSLVRLYLVDMVRITLPDTVKNMKWECLRGRCDIRLCPPIILDLSYEKRLNLTDGSQNFVLTKPFSLSKLSNLQHLTLNKCTSLWSFPELPVNLKELGVCDYGTLEQLPDLSSLKQLKRLHIRRCISLHLLPPLPPNLQSLIVHECTSLQDLPDLSMLKELRTLSFIECGNLKSVCLKQSSLQVGRYFFSSSFQANLPNTEVPEWFGYKSTRGKVSFNIPSFLGDKFLGVALWVVYKCKNTDLFAYIRAVITNETKGIAENYDIFVPTDIVDELRSRVECIRADRISLTSGDRIKVSFQKRLIYSIYDEGSLGDVEVLGGEVKVERCGAHVIQKTTFTPY